jgi:hypothetical protein
MLLSPPSDRFTIQRARALFAALLAITCVGLRAAAPTISFVSPNRVALGTSTTIGVFGSGLSATTDVRFGSLPAQAFTVVSDFELRVTTPANGSGLVDLNVTTPEGVAVLAEGFAFGPVPVALDDVASTSYNTTLRLDAPGVLLNDDPSGGGPLVAELDSTVSSGTLTFASDGGFVYTPPTDFVGGDSFTYHVRNAGGISNRATVRISVARSFIPLPPSDLFVSEVRGRRVTLRWNQPPPVSAIPAFYTIEGGTQPGATEASLNTGSAPVFTFDAPPGAFFVRVRAVSLIILRGPTTVRSEPSNEVRLFVEQPVAPSPPQQLVATVTGNALTLAWRNSYAGGEPASLLLDVSGTVNATLPLALSETTTFTGVPAGTYTLSLRARNDAGTSGASNALTVSVPTACSGLPQPPSRVIAYRERAAVTILWEPPLDGAAPSDYIVTVTGAFAGSFTTPARSMSGTVGPGAYTLTVSSRNACGTSPPSAPQTVVVAP